MAIHRAVGTSLLVITLIGLAGVTSHLFSGRTISIDTMLLFVVGGIVGMFLGQFASRRLSGPTLQQVFAVAIVAVASFVIVRTTLWPARLNESSREELSLPPSGAAVSEESKPTGYSQDE